MSKNILVTGGRVFIVRHVVNTLIKKKKKEILKNQKFQKRKDIKFIKGRI